MEHRVDVTDVRIEKIQQALRRYDMGELTLGNVAPLLATTEAVAHDEIVLATLLERSRQIRSDEAGAAGNDDHGDCPR